MPDFIPYRPISFAPAEQLRRAEEFYALLSARRTIREFSPAPVARDSGSTISISA